MVKFPMKYLFALALVSCASAPIAPDALTTADYCVGAVAKICEIENEGMMIAHCLRVKLLDEKRCGK